MRSKRRRASKHILQIKQSYAPAGSAAAYKTVFLYGGEMMTEQEIMAFARAEFYWLHAHPELAYEEYETTARLRAAFERFGIRVLDVPLETGLVAAIGTGKQPIVALRTDIDALPVAEATSLPYRSVYERKMHACGHDFHMAAVLAAALLLKEREAELEGTVYIVCQPAEEAPGGARCVLDTGVLNDVRVMFGIHTRPIYSVGTFGLSEGGMMASVDKFELTFTGVGTHAAQPDRGCDPVVMAAQFVTAAQAIVSRNVNPLRPAVLSVTHIKAGNTWNVLPEYARMEGTIRLFDADDRTLVKRRMEELAAGIAAGFGGQAETIWTAGPPAIVNTPRWAALARESAAAEGFAVVDAAPWMAGEDFAYYQESMESCFAFVGTGLGPENHHPQFTVDPEGIAQTARYLARVAVTSLRALKRDFRA